jgi:chloride channel protein, CIC family
MTLLNSRVIRISTASIITGILIGLVGGAFRHCLITANAKRDALIAWAHSWPHIGWLAPVALGLVGVGLARFLVVRFAPLAEGSGIQRVGAAFRGEVKLAPH